MRPFNTVMKACRRASGLGACAAEGMGVKRVGKKPKVAQLLRTVAVATAGKTGAKWDFSPSVAAEALLPRRFLAVCAVALGLAGCSVELLNTQPAREVAELAQPPGSVYAGWRVFQDRCIQCHGPAGGGGPSGPDLLPRVREMGPSRFVDLVLTRYDWNMPPDQPRPAQVQTIVQRKDAARTMPAWQGEPQVSAHIIDLYAYLSARAQGSQGPGRPQP